MSEFVDLYDRNRKFLNRVVDRNTYLFQPGEFMMYVSVSYTHLRAHET